ncbi:helix-turn-helix domain-containing protein [Streptomyces sp. NPDC046316]|uniref:helix-turn-helix domain-containing protein n=1 Tax=Streptomyces sp. NPDC046316 TaxID=3154494 RepID=UPI0033C9C444
MTTSAALARADLLSLPAVVDVETAGKAFGLGRTTAYALVKAGDFPCLVIKAGRSYRVITADLLRVLHVTPENSEAAAEATAAASSDRPTQTP